MTRFTVENWLRFRTHNKKTTTRIKPLKLGIHKCLGGPYYTPIRLGKVEVGRVMFEKSVSQLTAEDAIYDGFDTLCEYLLELAHRNPRLTTQTTVYIQPAKVVEDVYSGLDSK